MIEREILNLGYNIRRKDLILPDDMNALAAFDSTPNREPPDGDGEIVDYYLTIIIIICIECWPTDKIIYCCRALVALSLIAIIKVCVRGRFSLVYSFSHKTNLFANQSPQEELY